MLGQINRASSGSIALSGDAVKSASSRSPDKVVQINFTDSRGTNIPATVASDHLEPLLALLQRAKGTSA